MFLEFHRLDQYPMSAFDGTLFVVPAAELRESLGESSPLPAETNAYFLGFGQIRGIMELLLIGTLAEDGSEYELDSDYTYYLPLHMIAEVSAARLTLSRFLYRDPLYRQVFYETLQRRSLQAQRLDQELNPLRIPNYPDSFLCSVVKDSQVTDLLSVDNLALIGRDLYSAVIHRGKESLPQYPVGKKVYVQKTRLDENPLGTSPLLVLLQEKPSLPPLQHHQGESATPPHLLSGRCFGQVHHLNRILLGQNRLDQVNERRVLAEILEGLHGVPLYSFAITHPEAKFWVEKRVYHCTICLNSEVRLRYVMQDGEEMEASRPSCSTCDNPLDLYDGDPAETPLNCLECGHPVLWKQGEPDGEPFTEVLTPEDFEVMTLEELAEIREELKMLYLPNDQVPFFEP